MLASLNSYKKSMGILTNLHVKGKTAVLPERAIRGQSHYFINTHCISPHKLYMSKLCYTIKQTVQYTFSLHHETNSTFHHYDISPNILNINIMLYHQTNCKFHNYVIPLNTLYMFPLCYATKKTVHVKIMLYYQTCVTHYRYAIPRNTLYKTPLC